MNMKKYYLTYPLKLTTNCEDSASAKDDTGPALIMIHSPVPPPQPSTPNIMGHHLRPTSMYSPSHNQIFTTHSPPLSLSPIYPQHTNDPPFHMNDTYIHNHNASFTHPLSLMNDTYVFQIQHL